MRIVSFYLTKSFKLILEFDNKEYRILDVKEFLKNEKGKMKDICNDINLFMSAVIDEVPGTIRFANDVDFDPNLLYESSLDLDKVITCQKKGIKPRKITRLPQGKSKIERDNEKLLKLLKGL